VEHNSVLRPLNHLESYSGVEVTRVPFNEKGYVEPDDVKKAIQKNTKLVIVNHASNVIGTVQPIAAIGKICRESGVYFAVDASQTAGVLPIDVDAMCIDLLAFTGHKGLLGPTGIGGSYIGEEVPIRGTRFGGTGVRSAYPFHLEEFPYRMESGTLNTVGVAGLHAGQKWIEAQGLDNIHAREMKLWDRLGRALDEIDGVVTYCADTPVDHVAVLSFNVDGMEASDVGTMLDVEYNIACRTGLQCAPLVHEQIGTDKLKGTVRIGIGPFNTDDHIDTAIHSVQEIATVVKK
jgi:selenocysteine lyase/cysteine desulfurase